MTKKIYLTMGLPASGKSTFAKELVKEGSTFRVNKDDLRSLILCGTKWNYKKEEIITQAEFAAAKAILAAGFNVVVDDTNLSPKTRQKWEAFAVGHQSKVELIGFTQIDMDECIFRDSAREVSVGRVVIENMALRNGLANFSAYKQWVILDVDGTIANIDHRAHYVKDGNKDWNSFFKYCDKDTLREDVLEQVKSYVDKGAGVIVLSGRPMDRCGEVTMQWLMNNDVPCDRLFMRQSGDSRGDEIVKEEILDLMLKKIDIKDILVAFDDRQRIIRLWKSRGISVIECGDGTEY